MLRYETYICVKCGKPFTKAVGGVVMTPAQMALEAHPMCDACKRKKLKGIFLK